jgi:hypothetical protein
MVTVAPERIAELPLGAKEDETEPYLIPEREPDEAEPEPDEAEPDETEPYLLPEREPDEAEPDDEKDDRSD